MMTPDRYIELLSKDYGHRMPPEALQNLSDRVARLHVDKGIDLTSAIFSVIDGLDLNPAHVARIVEGANTQTYLKLYDRCTGPERIVKFEGGPARIFDVLAARFGQVPEPAMAKAASGRKTMTLDYRLPPSKPRPAVKVAEVDRSVLPVDSMKKAAAAVRTSLKTPGGRLQVYRNTRGALEKVSADLASHRYRFEKGARELLKLAAEALRYHSPEEVARAMVGQDSSQDMRMVTDHVMGKLGFEVAWGQIPWSKKVTLNHPLTTKTAALVELANSIRSENELRDQLQQDTAAAFRLAGGVR